MKKSNPEEIFQKNLEIWSKTCPKQACMLPYIEPSHLISCRTKQHEFNLKGTIGEKKIVYHAHTGAVAEAEKWFQSLPLNNISLVFVYGVGLGYYYDAIVAWLQQDRARRLVFLEDDLGIIRHLLETERGSRLLQDPQVHLIYFQNLNDETIFETLYWNFAMTRMVVSALQSYMEAKSDVFGELRQKIAYDAAMKNALVDEYMRYGASFYLNFYQNMLCLDKSYLGNQFFGKFPKVPAIICGAGPSLAKNIAALKGLLGKALVFAGGSALNVLNAAGIQPHFGAGIDPNPMQFKRLSENQGYEVPFFYRNRMFHQAFKMIHGPRLYITGSGGYDTAEFFEKRLGIHRVEFLDEGHNVVNFCVEVAHAMGCDPLIFVGMDLAFTGMKEYAPGVVEDASISQSTILEIEDQDAQAILRKDIFGASTYTLWKWVAESEWLGNYAKEHPLSTMINCTEGGLGFPGIANMPLTQAATTYLKKNYELKNRVHGETQNSRMAVTYPKVARLMKELKASLENALAYLHVLLEDNQRAVEKIKQGMKGPILSGQAALAETELVEEPAYKYVIEVFNEVYTRMLSGKVHELQLKRLSEKQRQLQKLALSSDKYLFLRDVTQLNKELIAHAFAEKEKRVKSKKTVKTIFPSASGKYTLTNDRLVIEDPELELKVSLPFKPIRVPRKYQDGKILSAQHVLRVIYDNMGDMCECYVEHKGVIDGQDLLFYSDGSVKQETFYRQGVLHGPSTYYDKAGKTLAQSWHIDGQQEGKSWWYYPSGSLYSLQRYRLGLWHGRQEFYYENGSPKTILEYIDGVLVGEPILLNENGTSARPATVEAELTHT